MASSDLGWAPRSGWPRSHLGRRGSGWNATRLSQYTAEQGALIREANARSANLWALRAMDWSSLPSETLAAVMDLVEQARGEEV